MNPDLPLNDSTLLSKDREVRENKPRIKLLGIGGAGTNAADRLSESPPAGVALAAVNTDSQALASSTLEEKVLIGWSITRGLSAGSDPELGRLAAEADAEKIERIITETDLLILVAGMGGGTGSGAAPVIAEMASKRGILVIAFVTLPFSFESSRRKEQAEAALDALRKACDAVIPLNNDHLLQVCDESMSALSAFAEADAWIARGVRALSSMLAQTGLINLDISTLRQVFLHRGGKTLFGFGTGKGEDPVSDAITELQRCPLYHSPEFARKADRLLVNITGGPDLKLPQINELMLRIQETFGRDQHTALGAVIDETRVGEIEVVLMGVSNSGPAGRKAAQGRARTVAPFPAQGSRPPVPAPAGTASGEPKQAAMPVPVEVQAALELDESGQDELPLDNTGTRGAFEKTERNLWKGQDLDTPTYLRRGIRIRD